MKVRELIEQLKLQDGDGEVRAVVEARDRKELFRRLPGDPDENLEFDIDRVVRENCGRVQANILIFI